MLPWICEKGGLRDENSRKLMEKQDRKKRKTDSCMRSQIDVSVHKIYASLKKILPDD